MIHLNLDELFEELPLLRWALHVDGQLGSTSRIEQIAVHAILNRFLCSGKFRAQHWLKNDQRPIVFQVCTKASHS
jgi:hypothetical protein